MPLDTRVGLKVTSKGTVIIPRPDWLRLEYTCEADLALFDEVVENHQNVALLQICVLMDGLEDYDYVINVPITDELFSKLSPLTELEEIQASNIPLRGYGFRYITSKIVKRISLSWCTATDELFSSLSHFQNLQMLMVRHCFKTLVASDLGLLAENRSLTCCDFDHNCLPDESFERFPELPVLRSLNLEANCLTGENFHFLCRLPKLETLYLNKNPITLKGIKVIANHANHTLGVLNFSECPNADDDWIPYLSQMNQLTSLTFEEAHITDASVPYFQQMQNLQYLELGGCDISKDACQAIHHACPRLTLSLPNGNLSNRDWSKFC